MIIKAIAKYFKKQKLRPILTSYEDNKHRKYQDEIWYENNFEELNELFGLNLRPLKHEELISEEWKKYDQPSIHWIKWGFVDQGMDIERAYKKAEFVFYHCGPFSGSMINTMNRIRSEKIKKGMEKAK